MNKDIAYAVQIVLGLALIGLIVIQAQGKGLDSSISGKFNFSTKRGVEKAIFNATIVIAVLFFISSVVQLLLV